MRPLRRHRRAMTATRYTDMDAAIIPIVFLIVIIVFGAILEHFFGG